MSFDADGLYKLLPAIYRIRDVEEGGPLRGLLDVIAEQIGVVEDNLAQLYDDQFIETCAEWAVPYIGDLLGVDSVHQIEAAGVSRRAEIANTINYRRRKGTASVLVDIARDITDWPSCVVVLRLLLAATQSLNHPRPENRSTVDLRESGRLALLGGPFDGGARTADVRRIDRGRQTYNLPSVGIWVWRLRSYRLTGVTARALDDGATGRFTFSPLGQDMPLFNTPRPAPELSWPALSLGTRTAAPYSVLPSPDARLIEAAMPAPLRRRPLYQELEARRQGAGAGVYFGGDPVLRVAADGAEIDPSAMAICDLGDRPGYGTADWPRPNEPGIEVAVDPVRGRLAFPAGRTPARVDVAYAYGFPADLGGGPYDRADSMEGVLPGPVTWQALVWSEGEGRQGVTTTLAEAVRAWNEQPAGTIGVIAVKDSRTYALPDGSPISVPSGSTLAIVAADWATDEDEEAETATPMGYPLSPAATGAVQAPTLQFVGVRPHLMGNVAVWGVAPAGEPGGGLILNGLLIEGGLRVLAGNLDTLRVSHCTLVPGKGGLTVAAEQGTGRGNENLGMVLFRSISGSVDLSGGCAIRLHDSILDGGEGSALSMDTGAGGNGVAVEIETSTILGTTGVQSLSAENSIFAGAVTVERQQVGGMRFCYIPDGSVTPRRYQCHPVPGDAPIQPRFTSVRYGDPGYCQLRRLSGDEILTGADDESEMGVYHFLFQPQRETNLRLRRDEYLRFGLEGGVLYAT